MQRMGQSGRGTASAVPGGLFAPPPDPQNRARLDGTRINGIVGKANSSSVAGGIFGTDTSPSKQHGGGRQHIQPPSMSSGGIFGDDDRAFKGGGYGGGYSRINPSAFEGAAGGKSTNAGQIRDGHFRGGTVGNQQYASTIESRPQLSNRPGASANFLDMLSEAEARDAAAKEEEERLMAQLQDEGLDQEMTEEEAILAAAEQLAEEMGLDEAGQRRLEEQLLAKHRRKSGMFAQQLPTGGFDSQAKQQHIPRALHENQDDGQYFVTEASQMAPKGDAFRASSKVLAPPGGVSSVCFG